MVSCWSFLCSGLSCLAHTREMFTSLWRSSNHLVLSRQPEGPGLRCHLFYYIYIKYIIFTINSINENRCCISILQLWEIAVGHEDVYVHSSLIKKVTPPFNQSSPMNRKWFPILFSVGSLRRCCHPEQSWRENDWYWRERNSLWWRIRLQVRTRNVLQHESIQNVFRHKTGIIAAKYDQPGYVHAMRLVTKDDIWFHQLFLLSADDDAVGMIL